MDDEQGGTVQAIEFCTQCDDLWASMNLRENEKAVPLAERRKMGWVHVKPDLSFLSTVGSTTTPRPHEGDRYHKYDEFIGYEGRSYNDSSMRWMRYSWNEGGHHWDSHWWHSSWSGASSSWTWEPEDRRVAAAVTAVAGVEWWKR